MAGNAEEIEMSLTNQVNGDILLVVVKSLRGDKMYVVEATSQDGKTTTILKDVKTLAEAQDWILRNQNVTEFYDVAKNVKYKIIEK